MKLYFLGPKGRPATHVVSNQHFGFDPWVGSVRFHSLIATVNAAENGRGALDNTDKREHKYCIKFPWVGKFRKDLFNIKKIIKI